MVGETAVISLIISGQICYISLQILKQFLGRVIRMLQLVTLTQATIAE